MLTDLQSRIQHTHTILRHQYLCDTQKAAARFSDANPENESILIEPAGQGDVMHTLSFAPCEQHTQMQTQHAQCKMHHAERAIENVDPDEKVHPPGPQPHSGVPVSEAKLPDVSFSSSQSPEFWINMNQSASARLTKPVAVETGAQSSSGRGPLKLMVCVDGSRGAHHAFKTCLDLVNQKVDKIIVVHSFSQQELATLPSERRPECIRMRYRSELPASTLQGPPLST